MLLRIQPKNAIRQAMFNNKLNPNVEFKTTMLSVNYLYFQKNSYRSVSSPNTNTADTVFTKDDMCVEYLDALECIVRLESKYLSYKDTQSTELLISNRIQVAICVLDKESFSSNEIVRRILEESKVLVLTVPRIEFLIDTLRTVVRLELGFTTTLERMESSQVISDLEALIKGTYSRLQSVIGSTKIRDEFVFSLSLLYPSHRARLLVDCFRTEETVGVENNVDSNKIKREKDLIKSNIKNFVDAPETLVTTESTKLDFLDLYKTSSIHFDSIKKVNEEIKDLKNKLRKKKVTTLSIQKAFARSLRVLDLENPKQPKPKKIRVRKAKKIKEVLEEDFDFDGVEETNDSDSE
jgi:hypothetical protein